MSYKIYFFINDAQVDLNFGNIYSDYCEILRFKSVFLRLLENEASHGFETLIRPT